MNQLQHFDFKGRQLRTVVVDNEPMFVGKDVADILGYQNGSRDVNNHVEEEDRLKYQIGTSGQAREMAIVNEWGQKKEGNTLNELIIMHDRQAVTTSLKVAESFGKNHRDVLAAIRDLMSSAENYAVLKKYFIDGSYTASNGKTNPMYYMNRDGFTLLAVGFTGKRALQFKIQYIQAFNSMETQIRTGYAIPGS